LGRAVLVIADFGYHPVLFFPFVHHHFSRTGTFGLVPLG
jgi:hypothetical protein